MHRNKDFWGPDGWSCSYTMFTAIDNEIHSARVRPRSFPRRTTPQISYSESVHLPPLQRWSVFFSFVLSTPSLTPLSSCYIGPRLCLGQQFAYNETSFMLIRIFQTFESVSLAPDAQPAWSRPPAAWKAEIGKRKSKEEFWPKTHLTMYSHVSYASAWVSWC
jgi:hypothetical protein